MTLRLALLLLLTACCLWAGPSVAQGPGRLIAIVNDQAISEYDLDQRVRLNATLNGVNGSLAQQRRAALDDLISNILKRQEAKRLGLGVTTEQIEKSYQGMAERAGVSQAAWSARLKKGGVAIKTVKQEIDASLSWRRVVRARFGRRIQVENADVDREYKRALKQPRKSEYLYVIRRILLPLKQNANNIQLSIASENARQIVARFNGCGRIRHAVDGIQARIQAAQSIPRSQAPADLRQALDQAGPGKAIGPGRGPDGVFVIAYCEAKKVEEPPVTRETIEQQLLYRKFDRIGSQLLSDLKRDAIIEYKTADLRS